MQIFQPWLQLSSQNFYQASAASLRMLPPELPPSSLPAWKCWAPSPPSHTPCWMLDGLNHILALASKECRALRRRSLQLGPWNFDSEMIHQLGNVENPQQRAATMRPFDIRFRANLCPWSAQKGLETRPHIWYLFGFFPAWAIAVMAREHSWVKLQLFFEFHRLSGMGRPLLAAQSAKPLKPILTISRA